MSQSVLSLSFIFRAGAFGVEHWQAQACLKPELFNGEKNEM